MPQPRQGFKHSLSLLNSRTGSPLSGVERGAGTMRLPDKTLAIVRQMERVEESKHFIIRFSTRNPPPRRAGRGHGPLGVRSPHLISCYVAALENLFETLVAGP